MKRRDDGQATAVALPPEIMPGAASAAAAEPISVAVEAAATTPNPDRRPRLPPLLALPPSLVR